MNSNATNANTLPKRATTSTCSSGTPSLRGRNDLLAPPAHQRDATAVANASGPTDNSIEACTCKRTQNNKPPPDSNDQHDSKLIIRNENPKTSSSTSRRSESIKCSSANVESSSPSKDVIESTQSQDKKEVDFVSPTSTATSTSPEPSYYGSLSDVESEDCPKRQAFADKRRRYMTKHSLQANYAAILAEVELAVPNFKIREGISTRRGRRVEQHHLSFGIDLLAEMADDESDDAEHSNDEN